MLKKILIASFVASAFAGAPLLASAQERAAIIIDRAPPPVREERVPEPRRGMEWAPGYWAWRHGDHVWVEGRWMRERHGEHWVADRWIERDGRWVLMAGHWERGSRMGGPGWRDRDGDGVPNRYDAHPDNPYRR